MRCQGWKIHKLVCETARGLTTVEHRNEYRLRLRPNKLQALQHNVLDVSTAPTLSFKVNAGVEPRRGVTDRPEDAVLDGNVANATRLLTTNRHMLACERAVAKEHVLRRFVKRASGKVNATLDSNGLQIQAKEKIESDARRALVQVQSIRDSHAQQEITT